MAKQVMVAFTSPAPGVDEDEFNRWYDEEHIPEKRATPGFRSARRYVSHDIPGRYLALCVTGCAGVAVLGARLVGRARADQRGVE